MFILIEQHELIKKDGSQSHKQLAAAQALDRHLFAPFEDGFEQPIERFDGLGPPRMKDPPDCGAAIGMRIGPKDRPHAG
jgi:hypothetical protein